MDKQPIIDSIAISKLKVEWAKKHVGAVEHFVKQVISENTDIVTIDNNTNPAIINIGPKRFLPADLYLHVGDAIHNLNSVTDYLWSGAARAVGSTDTARLSFPRHEERKNLLHSIDTARGAHKAIYESFPKAKSFVLDIIKPYKGGDDPSFLWNLNKLDNINKHRFLLIITNLIRFDGDFDLIGADGGRIKFSSATSIYTQGGPMPLGLTPPVKTDREPKAIVDVVFNESDHFTGKPVIETLINLTEAVAKLISLFEKFFL